MTREELIISEAKKYYAGNIQCYDAFLHGTEFADEHPINVGVGDPLTDVPSRDCLVVLRGKNGRFGAIGVGDCDVDFRRWCKKHNKIYKWAYITDICPEED